MGTSPEKEQILYKILGFLESIAIAVVHTEIEGDTFLPGLRIEHGKLLIDQSKLKYVGDILHEAGHIAVSPFAHRSNLNGDIMINSASSGGEEMAAMLWSYAACKHIDLDPTIVFHEEGYKDESQWLLDQYCQDIYPGLPLLQWMGLTYTETESYKFPKMKKWVRD